MPDSWSMADHYLRRMLSVMFGPNSHSFLDLYGFIIWCMSSHHGEFSPQSCFLHASTHSISSYCLWYIHLLLNKFANAKVCRLYFLLYCLNSWWNQSNPSLLVHCPFRVWVRHMRYLFVLKAMFLADHTRWSINFLTVDARSPIWISAPAHITDGLPRKFQNVLPKW